jgi:hypothetical protein
MAKPSDNSLLEKSPGGLPLVRDQGLNTNKAVNFSGTQIDTSGNLTLPQGSTITTNATGTSFIGSVTGPTGSFNGLNIQQSIITGSSASVAILGTAGASGGGPTTSQMNGWAVVYVAGVKCWIPVWQ